MRKVRQFQFEIRDLFGCSDKPFSCDVEIRYADQMTVMLIKIQVCTQQYSIMSLYEFFKMLDGILAVFKSATYLLQYYTISFAKSFPEFPLHSM